MRGVALGHDPPHAGFSCGGPHDVCSLGPEPDGLGEAPVEVFQVGEAGQGGRSVTSWPALTS